MPHQDYEFPGFDFAEIFGVNNSLWFFHDVDFYEMVWQDSEARIRALNILISAQCLKRGAGSL